jgi:hypothetical protein
MQVPEVMPVITLPSTLHVEGVAELKTTVNFEVALALTVAAPSIVSGV